MSRLSFFKGLLWGLCFSSMIWWGIFQVVGTVVAIAKDIPTRSLKSPLEKTSSAEQSDEYCWQANLQN